MTKKEEVAEKATKLSWRLKEQPTTEKLRELVKDEIISKEEARNILFNKEDDRVKTEALQEEIKFLRELVDTLASKANDRTTIVHKYEDWTPHYHYWYKRYEPIFATYTSSNALGSTTLTTTGSMSEVQSVNAYYNTSW